MIEGIQFPDLGEILIKGKPWKGNETAHHKILGISLQETRLIDKLTVTETLKLFSSFFEADYSKISEIIELIGLNEKKKSYVVNLSGGQRQKLAMGISLINDPEILLLDEPTTGLDPNARREIWQILLNLKHTKNTSMILTTHYMEEAEQLCDRIIIMDKGKILAQGTLDELLAFNNSNEIIEFVSDKNMTEIPATIEMLNYVFDKNENKGIVQVTSIVDYLPKLMDHAKTNSVNLKSIECRKMTLDDLFVKMTGRRLKD
jgi:ABC-2 type transport system ATP-binding protein